MGGAVEKFRVQFKMAKTYVNRLLATRIFVNIFNFAVSLEGFAPHEQSFLSSAMSLVRLCDCLSHIRFRHSCA
jgi:hypothetical protein